uniref:Uncharacterized protein n=1 Tax=Solanum lycopersicum TaxID=4081 RepID=A0A3Q7IKU8_SOLLC
MTNTNFFPILFAFIFISSYTICNANEVDDESKFNYLLGTTEGPESWGTIKFEWKLCETGLFQSPVNFRNKSVKITTTIPLLKPNYKNAPAMIVNRGHDIKVLAMGSRCRKYQH